MLVLRNNCIRSSICVPAVVIKAQLHFGVKEKEGTRFHSQDLLRRCTSKRCNLNLESTGFYKKAELYPGK